MSSFDKMPTVLFVDDEPDLLSALQDYFAPTVTVRTAGSANEGLALLQDYKPDVIVSDQRMKGMSGIEFLERSIELSPDSERVLMTGYSDISSIVQSINRARISYYIIKPIDFQQLRLTVEQLGEVTHLRRTNAELVHQLSRVNSLLKENVSLRDSELHAAYNHLQNLQRTREQMVRMAVHDLKAPLGNMELILTELLHQNVSPDDYQELVGIAKQSVFIMRSLVDDMLTVAMLTQPEFNPPKEYLSLTQYLRSLALTFKPTAERKHIKLHLDVPENLPVLHADPSQIQQMIYNLLSNAVKYTSQGGSVFFSAESDENDIIIRVRDTGLGMTAEDIRNAFQEFQRLSARPTGGESSTGLGLYIVKKVTELNGGSVVATSEGQGKGTTFTVRLPVPELVAIE